MYATWAQVHLRGSQASDTRVQLASRTAEHVRGFVTDTHLKLGSLADSPALAEMLLTGCTDELQHVHGYFAEFHNIFLASPDGSIVCSAVPIPDDARFVEGRHRFEGQQAGPFHGGNPESFGEAVVTIFAHPITDGSGGVLGYVGLAVAMDRFQRVVGGGTLPRDAIVTLAHKDGTVIARSKDPNRWVGRMLPSLDPEFGGGDNAVSRAPNMEGTAYDWASHEVPDSNWIVYAGLPQGWAFRSSITSLVISFALGGILLFGVIAVGARLYRTVDVHLRRLIENARAAAEGLVRLEEDGLDEVAEVARAFNATLDARDAAEEERRSLEEQILRAQKLEAVGRLAGAIAHDFNNRLAVIQGQAELLEEQFSDNPEVAGQLRDILHSANMAAALTAQLLTFSRPETTEKTIIDLNEMILKFEPVLRKSFKVDIEIQSNLHSSPCLVKANGGQLDQVFLNLANNARDAMVGGGRLSFTTRVETVEDGWRRRVVNLARGEYVVLSVSDTGAGMDRETRARAFEPFFTTKPADKGTGLGLTSAYAIIQEHGGAIQLYSSPGAGTSLEIWLPLQKESASSSEAGKMVKPSESAGSHSFGNLASAEKAEVESSARKGTILLAEDQPSVRRMIATMLTRANFEVLEARDGLEAVKIGRENAGTIDAMVTDWIMPGLRGPAAAAKLQETIPNLPVLFISGYTDEATGNITDQGIPKDRFLAKPFTRDQLLERMEALLSDVEAVP